MPLIAATSHSLLKIAFLIQKVTKPDKETIDKRVKEVPESDQTVCRETDLLLGREAQDPRVVHLVRTKLLQCYNLLPAYIASFPHSHGLHIHRVSDTFHLHRQSDQTRAQKQMAQSIGVQKERLTNKATGRCSWDNQEAEKSTTFHSHSEKMVVGKDTSVLSTKPETTRLTTALGRKIFCSTSFEQRSPCVAKLCRRSNT